MCAAGRPCIAWIMPARSGLETRWSNWRRTHWGMCRRQNRRPRACYQFCSRPLFQREQKHHNDRAEPEKDKTSDMSRLVEFDPGAAVPVALPIQQAAANEANEQRARHHEQQCKSAQQPAIIDSHARLAPDLERRLVGFVRWLGFAARRIRLLRE